MSKDWKTMGRENLQRSATLGKAIPETMQAFAQTMKAASAEGALSHKSKELMAVAISIAVRCEGCVAYHTRAAVKAGATREEFAETIAVAIEMGGGPSAIYGAEALEAYDQLAA